MCWRGWMDLERLDGVGCLEFDEERAAVRSPLFLNPISEAYFNHESIYELNGAFYFLLYRLKMQFCAI